MRLVKDNEIGIKKSTSGEEKSRIAEESHHAMHVLMLFVIMIHEALSGKRVGRRLLGRIMHHLMDLREFLVEGRLSDLANELYASIQCEHKRSLPLFTRAFHGCVRTISIALDSSGNSQVFRRISLFLISSSENEKAVSICMYPWLVVNQQKILEFARFYAKEAVFDKLIPVGNLKH